MPPHLMPSHSVSATPPGPGATQNITRRERWGEVTRPPAEHGWTNSATRERPQ